MMSKEKLFNIYKKHEILFKIFFQIIFTILACSIIARLFVARYVLLSFFLFSILLPIFIINSLHIIGVGDEDDDTIEIDEYISELILEFKKEKVKRLNILNSFNDKRQIKRDIKKLEIQISTLDELIEYIKE